MGKYEQIEMGLKIRTAKPEEKERAVWRLVEHRIGADAALPASEIVRTFGWPIREIRGIVRRLVDKGYPIYGSKREPYGYFVMETAEELDDAFREGYATAISILRRIRKYRKVMAEDLAGQIRIDLDLNGVAGKGYARRGDTGRQATPGGRL